MAALVSIQSTRALRTVGLGYLIFGCMVTALFFCLDYLDVDKDVKYSQEHAEYWLGLPATIFGIMVLAGGRQMTIKSKVVRICLSAHCFIASIASIVLEAPDWMRYLSDNRSLDTTCKLAMIAVPGLQREMRNSPFTCNRRVSYAWLVGLVLVSSILLVNYSVCSIIFHVWLTVKDQMTYKMPDYPAYSVKTEDEKAEKLKSENKEQGSTNMGFEEH